MWPQRKQYVYSAILLSHRNVQELLILVISNLPKLFWPGFLAKLNVNWYKSLNLLLSLRSDSKVGSLLRSFSIESHLQQEKINMSIHWEQ